jgi:muconolactone delta-isomerase
MASSPPKSALSNAFKQTWDKVDAAFLDPTSLPIARQPRAWERKQETTLTTQGKQKKVWRRYTTRMRADATPEDDEEEVHDSRSRAVKKQQRMSPRAMNNLTSLRGGNTRAFKATRWDRRKSVLPSRQIGNWIAA